MQVVSGSLNKSKIHFTAPAAKNLKNEKILFKNYFWNGYIDQSFSDRQKKVLNRLLDCIEGKMTSSKWATMAKCSQETASRDIQDLVSRHILKKSASSGRSTSYDLVLMEKFGS